LVNALTKFIYTFLLQDHNSPHASGCIIPQNYTPDNVFNFQYFILIDTVLFNHEFQPKIV